MKSGIIHAILYSIPTVTYRDNCMMLCRLLLLCHKAAVYAHKVLTSIMMPMNHSLYFFFVLLLVKFSADSGFYEFHKMNAEEKSVWEKYVWIWYFFRHFSWNIIHVSLEYSFLAISKKKIFMEQAIPANILNFIFLMSA